MEFIQAYGGYVVLFLFFLMLVLIGKTKSTLKQIQIFAWMGIIQLFILSLLGFPLLQKSHCYFYYDNNNIIIPEGGEIILYKDMKYCIIKTKDGNKINEVKVNDAKNFAKNFIMNNKKDKNK